MNNNSIELRAEDKHAYLIIAHNEPWLLKILVMLIDDERNDIFIEIDSKADINIFKDVKATKSNLFFTKRCDARWGCVSLVAAEYILFETAHKKGPYAYYHLISGVDLPLKSQDFIHNFCKTHEGKEFIGFSQYDTTKEIEYKTSYYHPFQEHFKSNNILGRVTVKILSKLSISIQKILHIKLRGYNELKKGCNWVSITDKCCEYILNRKDAVLARFNHTFCSDEIFLQSLIWNSDFYKNIFDNKDEFHSCLRKEDWKRGTPYVWQDKDSSELLDGNDDYFFARKFSSKNKGIILDIVKRLKPDIYDNIVSETRDN